MFEKSVADQAASMAAWTTGKPPSFPSSYLGFTLNKHNRMDAELSGFILSEALYGFHARRRREYLPRRGKELRSGFWADDETGLSVLPPLVVHLIFSFWNAEDEDEAMSVLYLMGMTSLPVEQTLTTYLQKNVLVLDADKDMNCRAFMYLEMTPDHGDGLKMHQVFSGKDLNGSRAHPSTILGMRANKKCPTCGTANIATLEATLHLLEAQFGPEKLRSGHVFYTVYEGVEVTSTISISTCPHCNPLQCKHLYCSEIAWEYRQTHPRRLVAPMKKDSKKKDSNETILASCIENAETYWAYTVCEHPVVLHVRTYHKQLGNCRPCA